MERDFYVPYVEGNLTGDILLDICRNVGGDEERYSFSDEEIEDEITYGDFIVELSSRDIASFTNCVVHMVCTNPLFKTDLQLKLKFKCVVVKQSNSCISMRELIGMPGAKPSVVIGPAVAVVPHQLTLIFFEETEDFLDYGVFLHDENKGVTICMYEVISDDKEDEDDSKGNYDENETQDLCLN